MSMRLHLDTHERLLHVKHQLEKETFTEALDALLDEHDKRKQRPE